jgi:hypothetical protein
MAIEYKPLREKVMIVPFAAARQSPTTAASGSSTFVLPRQPTSMRAEMTINAGFEWNITAR